ncbi:hypothetical protein [Geoalkalibacter halelectricus]|uniref:hypothetical protein n=1 Tax=Geoalkalibacter halelectricus TaxID=2847045 RepID=UPI003D213D67
MRREELYLADILEAADAIGNFLQGVTKAEFLASRLLKNYFPKPLILLVLAP